MKPNLGLSLSSSLSCSPLFLSSARRRCAAGRPPPARHKRSTHRKSSAALSPARRRSFAAWLAVEELVRGGHVHLGRCSAGGLAALLLALLLRGCRSLGGGLLQEDELLLAVVVGALALEARPRKRQKRRASPAEADLGNDGLGSRTGEPGADRGAHAQ